jgi:hypothetical protein
MQESKIKDMSKPIMIESSVSPKEAFINPGVSAAIAFAFMNPGVVVARDSREYAEIARAYWAWIPTDLIPKQLLDRNHSLYSGHRCRQCCERLLNGLVCDGHALDRSRAEQILNTWIETFRARNERISCSEGVCEIDLMMETCAAPKVKVRGVLPVDNDNRNP